MFAVWSLLRDSLACSRRSAQVLTLARCCTDAVLPGDVQSLARRLRGSAQLRRGDTKRCSSTIASPEPSGSAGDTCGARNTIEKAVRSALKSQVSAQLLSSGLLLDRNVKNALSRI